MPRLLAAPLNWGLGHATRSLPIVAALEAAVAKTGEHLEVHWASDGGALELLRRERPDDDHHGLPGYGATYPTASGTVNMLLNGPRLLAAAQAERVAVGALHARHAYDFVLSDHRYGTRVAGVPNACVCHQIHLPVGGLAGRVANALHHGLLGGFDELVVPDYPTPPRLAGAMSEPPARQPARYVGPVSRFVADDGGLAVPEVAVPAAPPRLLLLLSGPEPARSRFERRLLRELPTVEALRGERVVLVRGAAAEATPADAALVTAAHAAGVDLAVHELLTGPDLRRVLAEAENVVARPGYTSVMDVVALGRRGIVWVPTPGQPEQEALAGSDAVRALGFSVREDALVLAEALAALPTAGSPTPPTLDGEPLRRWAEATVARLR